MKKKAFFAACFAVLTFSDNSAFANDEKCFTLVKSEVMLGHSDTFFSHPHVYGIFEDPKICNDKAKIWFNTTINDYRKSGRMDLYPSDHSKSAPVESFIVACRKIYIPECRLKPTVDENGRNVDLFVFNYSRKYFDKGMYTIESIQKYLKHR